MGLALAVSAVSAASEAEGVKPVELGAGAAKVESHLTGASPAVAAIEAKIRGMRMPAKKASWSEVKKEEHSLKKPPAVPAVPAAQAKAPLAATPSASSQAPLHPTAAEQQGANAIEDKIRAMRKPVKKASWAEVKKAEAPARAKKAYKVHKARVSKADLDKDLAFVNGLRRHGAAPKKTSAAQSLLDKQRQVGAIESKVESTLPGKAPATLGSAQSSEGWNAEKMPAGYPMPKGDMGEAKGKIAVKPAPTAAKAAKATNKAVAAKIAKTAKATKLSHKKAHKAKPKVHKQKNFHEPKPAKAETVAEAQAHEAKVHAKWMAMPLEEVKRQMVLAEAAAAKKVPEAKKKP